MKKLQFKSINSVGRIKVFIVAFSCLSFLCNAQVGINTTDPKGTLDVTSINNTGLVMPRVSAIEDVTDGNGNPPLNGTTVYDLSRNTTCFYQNNSWICIGVDGSGNPILIDETPVLTTFNPTSTIDYIKSSITEGGEFFGWSLSLSGDGNTLVVGKPNEGSNATGFNGNESNNLATSSGAAYVFIKTGNLWSQQAYIKASNTDTNDRFGSSVSLSNDGNTLAVGAYGEDSNATGINGNQNDNSNTTATYSSGAVYVFNRTGTLWTQEAYIKASNSEDGDGFGDKLALSGDGNTLAIAATSESSGANGINGNQTDNSDNSSGAVYVFIKAGGNWSQQAYIKSSNADANSLFGSSIAISSDGNTLAVGAHQESNNAIGINGNQNSNLLVNSGAVYVFTRLGVTWTQQAYIKASNADANDFFGTGLALSSNGNTLAVGAYGEDSNASGINGNQIDNSVTDSGAAYVFVRSGTLWTQQAYIKASNAANEDTFGSSISLSNDGNSLAISALFEDSNTTGINGDETNDLAINSGAIYIFKRIGTTWTQEAYVKASNTGVDPFVPDFGEYFGISLALSGDASTLAVGAIFEDSEATGINGDQNNNFGFDSGAVYVYQAN